jgi:hypothetical protein
MTMFGWNVLGAAALLLWTAASAEPQDAVFCAYPSPGKVVYRGRTDTGLAACLDGAHERVLELRITSPGGDAAGTLKLAQRYAGRIEHLIVDTRCAAACASYIVPIAKRLTVLPGAFVIVHGSYDAQRVIDAVRAAEAKFRQLHPGETPHIGPAAEDAWAIEKAQDDFERQSLSCKEWLHPSIAMRTAGWARRIPRTADTADILFVSRTMAQRCLKTQIVDYWSPASEADIPDTLKDLGAVLVP